MFSYNVLYLPTFQVLDTQAAALSDYKKSMTAKKKNNQTFISVILNGLLILSELSEIVTTVQNLLAASQASKIC